MSGGPAAIAARLLPPRTRGALRSARALCGDALYDIRVNMLGQIVPMKPRAISMMANDICNSRCQMCLIWERKKDHEITPDELRRVLAEPLFSKLQTVGITGGEPTLRKDLPALFEVVASRPTMESASIITNAISERHVRDRVLEAARICGDHGVGFSVMVSLDGVGDVHDRVRGRDGNFETAVRCIEAFQDAGLNVSFGCTITKTNAPYVDEMMDWAQGRGLKGKFRVAEFIERLYNDPQGEFIRSFDPLAAYHLGLFFYRAEHEFETRPQIRKTYRSVRGMLAEGKQRTAGCPYHTNVAVLTSRGELLYCSPKSPNLGSILEPGTASRVFFGNLDKRRELIRTKCDDCIHDYDTPVSFREKVSAALSSRVRARRFDNRRLIAESAQLRPCRVVDDLDTLSSETVLITGWYGTETAGDKAILWGILDGLRKRHKPPRTVYVSSLVPFVTEWTKREMGWSRLRVVHTYRRDFIDAVERADEVIVGGGPLMDIGALDHILYAAISAARRGAVLRVEGCGLGPLENPLYKRVVGEVVRLSSTVSVRDRESAERCRTDYRRVVRTVPDPATRYLAHARARPGLLDPAPPLGPGDYVGCFLREWPRGYAVDLDEVAFAARNEAFERGLLDLLATSAARVAPLRFYAMHTFYHGGDDRRFARRLHRQLVDGHGIEPAAAAFQRLPLAPVEILRAMRHARWNICMRFHSVLFACELGVPFLAIDYTGGGKIASYLAARGCLDRLVSIDDVVSGAWRDRIPGAAG